MEAPEEIIADYTSENRSSTSWMNLLSRKRDDALLSKVEASGWLSHLRLVLTGVVRIVQMLDVDGASVVVHCSDGWDRTSQLTALAQLCLDPFYRTCKGFAILIEKGLFLIVIIFYFRMVVFWS